MENKKENRENSKEEKIEREWNFRKKIYNKRHIFAIFLSKVNAHRACLMRQTIHRLIYIFNGVQGLTCYSLLYVYCSPFSQNVENRRTSDIFASYSNPRLHGMLK